MQGSDIASTGWPHWRDRLPAPDHEGGRRLASRAPLGEKHLVSYLTVVRNAASTIQRTIDSVASQTFPRCEHIVVDGASTDGTLEILARNSQKLAYYASKSDQGFYQALNKAVGLCAGDLICVLNADDWLEPQAAEQVSVVYKQSSDAALYLTGAHSHYGWLQRKWFPAQVGLSSWVTCANVCHNGIYASRATFEKTGAFREDLKIAADFDWIMRAFEAGCRFEYVDCETVHYTHGGMSNDVRAHALECLKVLTVRFPQLEMADAKGLMGLFYPFRNHVEELAAWRPKAPGQFVKQVLAKYDGQDDLQRVVTEAVDLNPSCLNNHTERLRRIVHPIKRGVRSVLLGGPGKRQGS